MSQSQQNINEIDQTCINMHTHIQSENKVNKDEDLIPLIFQHLVCDFVMQSTECTS